MSEKEVFKEMEQRNFQELERAFREGEIHGRLKILERIVEELLKINLEKTYNYKNEF